MVSQVVLVARVPQVHQDKAIVVVVVTLGLAAAAAVKEVLEHLLPTKVLEGQVVQVKHGLMAQHILAVAVAVPIGVVAEGNQAVLAALEMVVMVVQVDPLQAVQELQIEGAVAVLLAVITVRLILGVTAGLVLLS
jgi:hypothetical protein